MTRPPPPESRGEVEAFSCRPHPERRSPIRNDNTGLSPPRGPRILQFDRITRARCRPMSDRDMSDRDMADYDLAIIGGGINGTGIARDAAGRGLRVLLVEQNDLASGTSSKSTKLIHGGLRYLEYYEFRLVREALIEREVLIRLAPHLTRPMRFVLPHHAGLRPAWLLRLGL